jgi:ERCC4-type nuclease
LPQQIKGYYDGTGENLSYVMDFIRLGVDMEQMKFPTGCPDLCTDPIWIDEYTIHADSMTEIKWTSSDFMESYKSHHLHSQMIYAVEHAENRLLAIVKTPFTVYAGKDMALLERQFQGMIQAVMVDYNCPVIVKDTQDDLIIWLVNYLGKVTNPHRQIFSQPEWVQKKNIDRNVQHWMLIPGIHAKRAWMIKEKYKTEHDLYTAIFEGDLGIDGIDKKLRQEIWDDFVQRGWIEE